MTSRCHGHQSGSHKSVRASQDTGVVRAMVLTPLPAPRSGIPSARSILATLGCKVLQGRSCDCVLHKPQTARHFFCSRICVIRLFDERCFCDSDVVCHPIFLASGEFPAYRELVPCEGAGGSDWVGMDLSAERSEDGASGWYTALWGRQWCQNHCSNHSGFLTGADTFVRSTLMAVAPGSHALSGAFLLVTFLWQDKEK